MTAIELVVFDMAGTTVRDDGVVEQAFARAAERTGVADRMPWDDALQYVRDTMGMSKIDVFTHLSGGDTDAAVAATAQFETAYSEIVAEQGVTEIPGAAATIAALRDAGLTVALTTGFAPVTRDALIDALGWHDLIDIALSPVDAGRGRPAPDLILTALLRTGTSSVQAVAVAGDTSSDVRSGRRAGAGFVAGVLSGAHAHDVLADAGADAVLDDITAVPAALRERGLLGAGRDAAVGTTLAQAL
ncbi:phosphonatase-like hydrolase [Microbacterium sp. A82]|uniref:phosphonatase-like hydrolase n=1 Tax=unclassified Microbacterium TaxID=2609290 RepID=UPI003F3D1AC4